MKKRLLIGKNLIDTMQGYTKRHSNQDGYMLKLRITWNFITAEILKGICLH
ncbi:hypothetical protein [Bacillus thuringiensis]|uniref:hypothetical protein n=1 Tax=Bacillus thuringiensis TaxID=1428 RepID=UPI0015D4F4F6|nr:hypothetical protein [Bacillus thuringiensis]